MLNETLRDDLTNAMKARDAVTTRTVRSLLTALSEARVAGAASKELTDEETLAVLGAQAKRRVEAAEAFDAGGRVQSAADERAELAVIERYLPVGLNNDELVELVDRILGEGGWTAKADMGTAMKAVNVEVSGRADGRAVAELVKARLS